MLTIRDEQMSALADEAAERSIERIAALLRDSFPDACATLGDDGVRAAIRHGIERAATYGLVAERDVGKYVSLMFGFGRDFDVDPTYPWAESLRDPTVPSAAERLDRAYDGALGYVASFL